MLLRAAASPSSRRARFDWTLLRRTAPRRFQEYVHPRCVCVPACPLRRDFASASSESEAHSSNSPGTGQNHNFFDINMLEIQGLPGDTNLASPGKSLFAMIMIIRWLQIRGLPGDSYEFCKRSEVLLSSSSERCVLWIFAALNGAFRPRPRGFPLRSFSWVILHNCSLLCMVCLVV